MRASWQQERLAFGVLAVLAIVHLGIVISVAKQPLRVNAARPSERSVIWPLHHDTVHRAGPGGDFFAVYHAGVKRARGESPYSNKEKPRVTPEFFPFRYLPIVAQTLGRAAIAVQPTTAYRIWIGVLELLLAACVVVVWREVKLRWALGLSAVLLLSSPYFLELHMGQFTFATSALLALGLLFLDRSDRVRSRAAIGGAVAFAAAALLKVFPLASGAALIRNRRGLVAAAVAGGLVAAMSVPYFALNPDDGRAFAKVNFGDTGAGGFHGGNYGFLYVIFLAARDLGGAAGVKGFLTFAAVWQLFVLGATAALVLWKKPSMLTGGLALAFAHMISYKHVWEHHASGAVVCGAFLLLRMVADDRTRMRWIALGCIVVLALPTPFVVIDALDVGVYDPTPQWSRFARYLLPMCKAIPALALWALALIQCVRESPKLERMRTGPDAWRSVSCSPRTATSSARASRGC